MKTLGKTAHYVLTSLSIILISCILLLGLAGCAQIDDRGLVAEAGPNDWAVSLITTEDGQYESLSILAPPGVSLPAVEVHWGIDSNGRQYYDIDRVFDDAVRITNP